MTKYEMAHSWPVKRRPSENQRQLLTSGRMNALKRDIVDELFRYHKK